MLVGIWIGADVLQTGGPFALAVAWFAFVPILLITVAIGSLTLGQIPASFIKAATTYRGGQIPARLEQVFRPPRLPLLKF